MERAAFLTAWREHKIKGVIMGLGAPAGNAATRIEAYVTKSGIYASGVVPEIEDLYQRQGRELDRKKRESLLHQIQQIVYDRAMYVPIYELAFLWGVGPRVEEACVDHIKGFAYSASALRQRQDAPRLRMRPRRHLDERLLRVLQEPVEPVADVQLAPVHVDGTGDRRLVERGHAFQHLVEVEHRVPPDVCSSDRRDTAPRAPDGQCPSARPAPSRHHVFLRRLVAPVSARYSRRDPIAHARRHLHGCSARWLSLVASELRVGVGVSALGARLYEIVREYAAIGAHHRTGTAEDARTLDWFENRLRRLGATTERQPWSFDRYDAEWSVTVDGVDVDALPLFYEGTGDIESTTPLTVSVSAVPAGRFPAWVAIVESARAAGARMAVVATQSPSGCLVAPNRSPGRPGSGLPALLVAGSLAERLRTASVRARLAARVVGGQTSNVIGRLGTGPDRDRILLTTPLSGWFRCAGERGTGIAVMLAVAERLAAEGVPMLVNGNSGHELVDLGAHHFAETKPSARSIFHFGASVAAGERDGDHLRLTDGVTIRASAPGAGAALGAAFAPIGKTPILVDSAARTHPESWVGEGRVWCTLDRPLISMAGGFPLFHTPEDVPEHATTPGLLERVYHAAVAAARTIAGST